MSPPEYVVGDGEDGVRLDRFLAARIPDVSRSRLSRWIQEGRVQVGEIRAPKPSLPVPAGSRVVLDRPAELPSTLVPEPIPLHVLHEDEQILVLQKPAGLTVHPGAGRRSGTMVHGLLHRYPDRIWPGPPERPGIVHRLDRDTTGLLVVARTGEAYLDLQRQISRREAQRGYLALVWGTPSPASGAIDAPIGRDPRDRRRMAVVRRGGRPARTRYRLLRAFGETSLIELRLETGRTHQIRVHMMHAGLPVFGDPVYGGGRAFLSRLAPAERGAHSVRLRRLNRQALHAYHLALRHPGSGRRWIFESPPPADLEALFLELSGRGQGTG